MSSLLLTRVHFRRYNEVAQPLLSGASIIIRMPKGSLRLRFLLAVNCGLQLSLQCYVTELLLTG
mgnify:CR=1 FL=1